MRTQANTTKLTYFAAVLFLTGATYWICDYYLTSIGKELVLSWAQTEAISIQEGNLLTSITKAQRFLLSSDYIKGVALVRRNSDSLNARIEFGNKINYSLIELKSLPDGVNSGRIGFLHQRIYFKVPSESDFVLIFDISSNFLNTIFLVFSSVLIFAVVYLIWILQKVERTEASKRESLIKIAIEDLLKNEKPSPVLENSVPGLLRWWTIKQSEIEAAKSLAVTNQSKIAFGELAAITAHDIKSSLRNIREIAKLVSGISAKQKTILTSSIEKVSAIASNLLNHTQNIQRDEAATRSKADLASIVWDAVNFKQNQYGSLVTIQTKIDQVNPSTPLNSQDLERSLHNLIDNAVEASSGNCLIIVNLQQIDQMAHIQLVDSGNGISNDALKRIGTKGFTSGKEGGTGLGLFYAKQFVEGVGGRLQIKSDLGVGTSVSLLIPTAEPNEDNVLHMNPDDYLLIMDDQETIRRMVATKFACLRAQGLNLEIFATPMELEKWLLNNQQQFTLISDYYLCDEYDNQCEVEASKKESGLDIIKRLGIQSKSIIFTSAHEDQEIHLKASTLDVRVISKEQFFEMKFILDWSKKNSSAKLGSEVLS